MFALFFAPALMRPDPWQSLGNRTTARIAMGRAGGSLPTQQCLAFAADHADARDAVYSELDVPALAHAIDRPTISMHSKAADRTVYLQRPDLGRELDEASIESLKSVAKSEVDIVFIIADGLSATAAQRHAPDVIKHLTALLTPAGFTIGPICIVSQARVAIADQIGALLKARLLIILIGERPGLGLADSLGAYLTFQPAVGKTDADRNCVSNINPPPSVACRGGGNLVLADPTGNSAATERCASQGRVSPAAIVTHATNPTKSRYKHLPCSERTVE